MDPDFITIPDEDSEKSPKDQHVRVRYRFGDKEMEAEGSIQQVDKHTMAFFKIAAPQEEPVQLQLPEGVSESEAPSLPNSNGAPTVASNQNPRQDTDSLTDLLTFYRKTSPVDQKEQVLVIAYYLQFIEGRERLDLDDYRDAYAKLKRFSVPEPSNYKSSIRNVVDRTDLLYNPERGKFALTIQGEEYVKQLYASVDA